MPLYYTVSNFVATAATTATVGIWTQWVATTSTAINQDAVWTSWLGVGAVAGGVGQQQRAPTQEEGRAAREQHLQQQAGARAHQQRQAAIEAKARELLRHYLNEKQRADLDAHHWFVVDGKSGVRYRIKRNVGMAGNIDVLNPDGSVRHRLCGHDRTVGTPLDDQILTQKFYLEHHEEEFLRIANRH